MTPKIVKKLIDICLPDKDLSNVHYPDNLFGVNNLTEEQRIEVEKILITIFDFRKIIWLNKPTGGSEDGKKSFVVQTTKINGLGNDIQYTGKVGYVYTMMLTPKMYDPMKDLRAPVKDGCVFTPIVYDPITFIPTQSITLTWSPEMYQDINAPERTLEDEKQMIRDMLEKVLSNPEEYRPEGFRSCIIRFAAI